MLRSGRELDTFDAVQLFVNRLALLLLALALMHFTNVFVFWRIRQRREERTLPRPSAAHVVLPPPPHLAEE